MAKSQLFPAHDPNPGMLNHLHPLSAIGLFLFLLSIAIAIQHPVLLGILSGIVLSYAIVLGLQPYLFRWLRILIGFGFVILLINLIVNSRGQTLFWQGFRLPLLGRLDVSLEELVFSLVMVLRLWIMFALFLMYQRMTDADRLMTYFSKRTPRAVILLSLTIRMVPRITRDVERIKTVLETRGVDFKRRKGRIRIYAYLLKTLVLSTLEGAWETAEAMHARGFGSGRRTRFQSVRWRWRDTVVMIHAAASAAILFFGTRQGWNAYGFYPQTDPLFLHPAYYPLLLAFVLIILPVLHGGCKRWSYLLLKI